MTIPLDVLANSVRPARHSRPRRVKGVPATLSATAIIQLSARLRMACLALDIEPDDVQVEDLTATEQTRLIRHAVEDFWKIVQG